MDFDKSIDSIAVHILTGKRGDILQLPGIRYFDCSTNPALQVGDLYNHLRVYTRAITYCGDRQHFTLEFSVLQCTVQFALKLVAMAELVMFEMDFWTTDNLTNSSCIYFIRAVQKYLRPSE